MSAIGRELLSTGANAFGGFALGSFMDGWSGEPEPVNDDNWLRVVGEIVVQLTMNGILATGYVDMLARRGYGSEGLHGVIPFVLATHATQPKLNSKLLYLSDYARNKIFNFVEPPSVSSGQVATGVDVKTVRPESSPL